MFSKPVAFFATVCFVPPLYEILWPCPRWRESVCIPAGVPVDWTGLAGWLAGSEYQCPLSRLSALTLWLSGNTGTQLLASDSWRKICTGKQESLYEIVHVKSKCRYVAWKLSTVKVLWCSCYGNYDRNRRVSAREWNVLNCCLETERDFTLVIDRLSMWLHTDVYARVC